MRPFFLEVMYQSRTDGSVLPSLMMDEAVATGPDTCDNWFLDSLGYHKQFSEDDPIPGDAIIRANGYIDAVECESLWYWKPDTTDAPNGMPDFDQYQFRSRFFRHVWSHCSGKLSLVVWWGATWGDHPG